MNPAAIHQAWNVQSLKYFEATLGPALIAFSIAIVLALAAAAVYFAYTAPGIFFPLLALVAGYFGLAYWRAAREARRAEAARRNPAVRNPAG